MKNILKSRKNTVFSWRTNLEALFWKHNYNCYDGTGSKSTGGFCVTRQGLLLPSIRSSDIAFTMGAKGPLWERAKHFDGEIPLF